MNNEAFLHDQRKAKVAEQRYFDILEKELERFETDDVILRFNKEMQEKKGRKQLMDKPEMQLTPAVKDEKSADEVLLEEGASNEMTNKRAETEGSVSSYFVDNDTALLKDCILNIAKINGKQNEKAYRET